MIASSTNFSCKCILSLHICVYYATRIRYIYGYVVTSSLKVVKLVEPLKLNGLNAEQIAVNITSRAYNIWRKRNSHFWFWNILSRKVLLPSMGRKLIFKILNFSQNSNRKFRDISKFSKFLKLRVFIYFTCVSNQKNNETRNFSNFRSFKFWNFVRIIKINKRLTTSKRWVTV